ncbi:unnamed protein product, partial [Didymodactylos carnosus]
IQYYLNELNVAILTPNVRGSTGYGKTYESLDNQYLRENSVKDIGALLTWIDNQSELDSKMIVVNGASYGGYMVLASMIHYGAKLKAGIEKVGISNYVTFLQNTSAYRQDIRRQEYGDERDPKMYEFLQRISPSTNVHKIDKPMLIAQGMNDPRVPMSQSDHIVECIRRNGVDVQYLIGKNEGHGFNKKSNIIDLFQIEIAFVKKIFDL